MTPPEGARNLKSHHIASLVEVGGQKSEGADLVSPENQMAPKDGP